MQPKDSNKPRPNPTREASPLQRGMSFLDFLARRIAAGIRATFAAQPVGRDEMKPKLRRRGKSRRDR